MTYEFHIVVYNLLKAKCETDLKCHPLKARKKRKNITIRECFYVSDGGGNLKVSLDFQIETMPMRYMQRYLNKQTD